MLAAAPVPSSCTTARMSPMTFSAVSSDTTCVPSPQSAFSEPFWTRKCGVTMVPLLAMAPTARTSWTLGKAMPWPKAAAPVVAPVYWSRVGTRPATSPG